MKLFITFVGEYCDPGVGGAHNLLGQFEREQFAIKSAKEYLERYGDEFWGHVYSIEKEMIVWESDA